MQVSLLRTKLTVPPLPPQLLERGRLVELLENAARSRKLTVIAAPAGYGKTVLAAQWAHRARMPVGWLSVDPDDQDPERFLRYLFGAWVSADPEIEASTAGVLLSGMAPDIDTLLAELVRFASDSGAELALVIDDCHLIGDPEVYQVLTYLLDRLPSSVHFILTGRVEPPLPLARYRARQELAEFGVSELQFTGDESASLLCDVLGLDLSREDIAPLTDRLEGWAAGLQLVSLTLRSHGRAPPVTISGRHRFIADYLQGDVLVHLPGETRDFLVRTCILDHLSGSLCDAVTETTRGQEMLERLEREHLFTLPLDDNREWFRYHPLFADVLRQELERHDATEVAALHRRAATWYLDHEMPDPAFDHALAAEDLPLVTDVLERYAHVKLFTGQLRALHDWLGALPNHWYDQHPELGLLRVAWLMFTGQFETAVETLDSIDRIVSSPAHMNQRAMGRVSAIRCFIACEANAIDQAERFADVALETLPSTDDQFRGGVWGALGDVYRRNGRWSEAKDRYLRALPHSDTPAGYVQSVSAYGALADLELRQGHLDRAAEYWRKALAVINDEQLWGAYPLPVIGWVHIRQAEILYERNDLDAARDATVRGRERAALGGDPRAIIAGGILAARLRMADGDLDAAAAHLEAIRSAVNDAQFTDWSSAFERCQLELWLAQGKLRTAVSWSDAALESIDFNDPDQEPTRLAAARVLIVKGDSASRDRAVSLLHQHASEAEESGRMGVHIEAVALQALAQWGRGDRAEAITSLEHALRMAEPEGYVRTFTDLGLPLARVLQEARRRKVMPNYVDRLLSSFGPGTIGHLPEDRPLPEPLTDRELDVLRRIATGLTNREIAKALFISAETVKKHTSSIYGKLGVGSRTEAVARSRDLDLID